MTQETPTEHSSLVGGSTATRRLNCYASYHLEQIAPKSKGSSYAREGTALHEMIALVLDKNCDPYDLLPFTHKQPPKGVEPAWELTIEDDLWDRLGTPALDMFDDFLNHIEADQEGEPAVYMVEESGEFPCIPGAFGTSDVPFRCGKIGGIWDWKFGRSHVSAEENAQLMFYFAAVRHKYPKFFQGVERIVLCISQPQCNDQEPETWETTPERIERFIDDLIEAIERNKEKGHEPNPGGWCKFADCKAVCSAHVGAAAKLGEKMSQLDAARDRRQKGEDGELDMGAFLGEAMLLAEMAESWAKHIASVTQERLEAGLEVPGYKVVEKKSSGREWTIPDEDVVKKLKGRGLKADDYYVKKVVTPPAAEKALKKLGKDLPDDIVRKKPSSGYTLTAEGDPRREAVLSHEKAAAIGASLLAKTSNT